jgi:uncharacterized phage-associated protein
MGNQPQKYEYDIITSELAMARLPSNSSCLYFNASWFMQISDKKLQQLPILAWSNAETSKPKL